MPEGFQEFMQSEEGRNMILNTLLAQSEDVGECKKALKLLDGLNFEDLTPAFWAQLVSYVGPLTRTILIVETATSASATFLDDPEAIRVVGRNLGMMTKE